MVDKSNSMLNDYDIWNGNQSPDDSKNFIANFKEIDESKKISLYGKVNLTKNKNMTRKPKHLSVR